MTESQLNTINYLTEAEYEEAKTANNINENELYITPDNSSTPGLALYVGRLNGGNYISIPNLNKYKKLEITWGAYVNDTTPNLNTGGVSNILNLDLTRRLVVNGKSIAIGGNSIAYFDKPINDSTISLAGTFYIRAEANLTDNKFGCAFAFNTAMQNNNDFYYVSKIVGYE